MHEQTVDRDTFAHLFRDALAEAGIASSDDLPYDSQTFALDLSATTHSTDSAPGHSPVTGPRRFYLHNVYSEYLRAPEAARSVVIQKAVSSVRETPSALSPEDARSVLRVQLRPRAMADRFVPGHRVVAERLALCLCFDRPASVEYASPAALTALNLDDDTAFALGLAGLEGASRTGGALEHEAYGVYRSTWRDTYDAARAILPWLVRTVPATDGHVVAVPNRDTLLVADRGDALALEALVALVEHEWDNPRRVSCRLLDLRGDELAPLEVAENHPARAQLHKLDVLDAIEQASIQQKLIQSDLHDDGGEEDIFVASLTTMTTPGGRFMTCTVLTDGVDTLLPRADAIAFVSILERAEKTIAIHDWPHVEAVLGSDLEPTPYGYPPRFRVRAFPASEQMVALGTPMNSTWQAPRQ
jgi:hypothetical protein